MFLCFISEKKKHNICLVKNTPLRPLFGLSAIPVFFNKYQLSAILQVDWLPGYKLSSSSSSSSWTYSSINLIPSWLLTAYASKEQSPPWMLLNNTYQASLQQLLVDLSLGAIRPELIFNNPPPKKKYPFFISPWFPLLDLVRPFLDLVRPLPSPTTLITNILNHFLSEFSLKELNN